MNIFSKNSKSDVKELRNSLKALDKVMDVIDSCRTFEHLVGAEKMIDAYRLMFPKGDATPLSQRLRKRYRTISNYGETLEGMTVMVVANENEPVRKGIVKRFTDFDKFHQEFLPMVEFEDGEYLCMGIVLPFDQKIMDELNEIDYKERFKHALKLRKFRNSFKRFSNEND